MSFRLKYKGKGVVTVTGVGTFGAGKFDREKKKMIRIVEIECSENIAKQFVDDARFEVLGISEKKQPKNKKKGV